MSWLTVEYLGVEVWQFGLAALVIALTVPFKQYLETKVLKQILRLFSVGKYQRKLADALDAPIGALVYLGALHLVIYVLGLKGHMSLSGSAPFSDLCAWIERTYV
ncbi:MAG: hypothetical protein KDK65_05950, partial [Chlamydiia bacterium]|nr:hypothetical protein [Chlamydiia bacterium]